MRYLLQRLLRWTDAQPMIEYVLLLTLFAVATIAGIASAGRSLGVVDARIQTAVVPASR
jgi:Flp pilus assembly pilin Flp